MNIAAADGGLPPIVVFGLDGVLYDTRHRTLQILLEYADDVQGEYPDVAEALRTLHIDAVHFLLSQTLRECGVHQAQFVRDVATFWHERYHADEYVSCDVPVPGAREYVCALYDAGAGIAYLSGRDVPGMLIGTVASLRDHGFPLAQVGVEMVLKPDATLGDESFKRKVIPDLSSSGDVVAFFDDQLPMCEVARQTFPKAEVAFVDTWHVAETPAPETGIVLVRDFRV